MSISNYAENEILDHVLGTGSWTMPSQVYASLHDDDPGETGANEVEGGSYARQAVDFGAASSGATSNTGALTFADMPALTVSHLALWDAETSGNCLWTGALASPKAVGAGDSVVIAIGDLDVSLD